MTYTTPIAEIGRAAVESATRAAKISMDSAERTLNVQIEYARGAPGQAQVRPHRLLLLYRIIG